MWIFGYGSLLWRPSLPYVEKHPGYVEGWSRRFWQGSTDHRGVPGAPGRVVTLVADQGAKCWGMAYRIEPQRVTEVTETLDHREKGGYDKLWLDVNFAAVEGSRALDPVPALLYVATPENKNYLGPADLEEIALQVCASHGPSGANVEYVQRLKSALEDMHAHDEHVFELAKCISRLETKSPPPPAPATAEPDPL